MLESSVIMIQGGEKSMKNKRRFRKRFIFAAVAVLLIAGILSLDLARNVSVAEAKQNVTEPDAFPEPPVWVVPL
mgnify:CR=1 FL=1